MDEDRSKYWPEGYPLDAHAREALQSIATEKGAAADALVAAIEKDIALHYHVDALVDGAHGNPAEQRAALKKLIKQANALADTIDRLSMLPFGIVVDPANALPEVIDRLSASWRDDMVRVLPETRIYKRDNELKLAVSKMYRVMADRAELMLRLSYRNKQPARRLAAPGEKAPRNARTSSRNDLIHSLALTWEAHTPSAKAKSWQSANTETESAFLRLVNVVLEALGEETLGYQMLRIILSKRHGTRNPA